MISYGLFEGQVIDEIIESESLSHLGPGDLGHM